MAEPAPVPPALISCDEAGFTGPKLLDDNQPIFAYAAIDLSADEADALVKEIKAKYRVQAPELKSKSLRKRDNWLTIALDVVQRVTGRAIVIAADKRLNLGGKAFEYLFEPVLEAKNGLFYHYDLHRFVMNAMHRILFIAGEPVPKLAHELQAFMKSFNPADAPTLFAAAAGEKETNEILDYVLRFARGYAQIIAKQSEHLRADDNQTAKWTLDLTTTCLFSLILHGWGHRHDRLDILCDDSKPLQAMAHIFDGMVGKTLSADLSNGRQGAKIQAHLANPLRFGSSADNPTLQVADVVAGATADVLQHVGEKPYRDLYFWVGEHMHQHFMLPADELIDTRLPGPRVNLAALKELARRADSGENPLDGMKDFYAAEFRRAAPPPSGLQALLATLAKRRR
ncbi:MAG: DUF3800 domain-containing protein [Mesorhizobium sp.]|uniref:DUF3800 domain-containing protein n=1 Tax=Mesorhizobium sp. TaxID=1871066 RepID=UPI001219F4E9|nr:DUF3800 domain-containing protein [Mesorhizobium sp.]TIQ34028.1 MAG: DUF3800 domain-containing protein [Mesorhizobium sp.]